jgi:hypothetical protein
MRTDSIYSYNHYDPFSYDEKPEKQYALLHDKIKDTVSGRNIHVSEFRLTDDDKEYYYLVGFKDNHYYFFDEKNQMIDSVSLSDRKKRVEMYPFSKFFAIKVKQVIQDHEFRIVLELRRRKMKMFNNFNVYAILISYSMGPSFIFRDDEYELVNYPAGFR